jgi:alpha-maltose-1-phosphate synthase
MDPQRHNGSVMIACPDARPPAYQAVIGLSRAGLLDRFITSSYFNLDLPIFNLARMVVPQRYTKWEPMLRRRNHPEIPSEKVCALSLVDILLQIESRAAGRKGILRLKRLLAQARTTWFDQRLSRIVARRNPSALLVFSDVASDWTLSLCHRLGIPAVLSMVHGDVWEETEILNQEANFAPEYFPLYLGDGLLDQEELGWLHARRLRDIALADLVLVPSHHIAMRLISHGTEAEKIRIIPYAADCRRFRPLEGKHHGSTCTFLFAGGISQRKGIKYLLEAWDRVRRPGWKLQLVGALPKNLGPLSTLPDQVEVHGRVGHSEMPTLMAAADVFVFPSLFEGSAVVTYEALACGLPCVVTPAAGSVVRDGIEGFLVESRDVDLLARRMEQLGNMPELRTRMSITARRRALDFDWPHYHNSIVDAIERLEPKSLNPSVRSAGLKMPNLYRPLQAK